MKYTTIRKCGRCVGCFKDGQKFYDHLLEPRMGFNTRLKLSATLPFKLSMLIDIFSLNTGAEYKRKAGLKIQGKKSEYTAIIKALVPASISMGIP